MSGTRRTFAVVALAVMLFTFLTSEVFAAGAMAPLSRDLGVSAARVGSLVTVYAVVAALAIPVMSVVTRGISPRVLLPGALLVLGASHLVMAGVSSVTPMVVARGAAALFHGVVWASAPAVAAGLLPGRPARATGYVFIGSSLGNVVGAPFVAAMSTAVSWRGASLVLAGLSLVAAVVLGAVLPRGQVGEVDHGGESGATGSWRPVAGWSLTVALVAAAHLAAFTFIAPLSGHAGVSQTGLPLLLFAMGAAGFVGTLLAGPVNDRWPLASVLACLGLLLVAFVVTTFPLPWFAVGTLTWTAAYSALTVALQAAVLRASPGWSRLASSWYVLAFQVGIAGGAALGGVVVTGPGAASLSLVSAGLVGAALLLVAARVVCSRS